MCGYFSIGSINFIVKNKRLLDYTTLSSPKEFRRNDKMFSITKKIKMKKIYCVICGKYRKIKNLKISCIFEKTLVLSIISSKCENEDDRNI